MGLSCSPEHSPALKERHPKRVPPGKEAGHVSTTSSRQRMGSGTHTATEMGSRQTDVPGEGRLMVTVRNDWGKKKKKEQNRNWSI